MAASNEILSLRNPVFAGFAFYAAILVLKMFAMAVLTAKNRFAKKVFANPEDARSRSAKVKFDDPDVERVRRAHLNDLENIPAFLIVGFLYVLTNPSQFVALNLFRVFTAARIIHTIVYAVVVIPQPARALSFFVGVLSTVYMAVQVILSTL